MVILLVVQTDKLHAQLRRLRNESSVLKDAVITAIPSHYSRVFFTCARVTSPVRGVDLCAQQLAQSTDSGVSCHLNFLTFSDRGQHTLLSGYLNFCLCLTPPPPPFFSRTHTQHQILFCSIGQCLFMSCVKFSLFGLWMDLVFLAMWSEVKASCFLDASHIFIYTHSIRWSSVSHITVLVP